MKRDPQLASETIRQGGFYRLPSGRCVVVIGTNQANVSCRYEGTSEEVGLRREFFLRQARPVASGTSRS